MPTPTALRLKRPLTTFMRVLNGARGSRLLPSSICSPAPLAHQWLEFTPLPQNKVAMRFGKAAVSVGAGVTSAPQVGSDSSHGKDIVTPTPRRKVRRVMRQRRASLDFRFGSRIGFNSLRGCPVLFYAGIGGW